MTCMRGHVTCMRSCDLYERACDLYERSCDLFEGSCDLYERKCVVLCPDPMHNYFCLQESIVAAFHIVPVVFGLNSNNS